MKPGDVVQVRIERLLAGGDAIARHEAPGGSKGMVVFVPFAAPGDVALVQVVERKKGFVKATLVELVERSGSRRAPRCAHFGTCGGCTWQHVEYAEQLRWKQEIVRESLRRIGGIEWVREIPIESASEWGYRSRAQWKVAAKKGSRWPAVGYHARGSHEVVDVRECPILAPELERVLARERERLHDAPVLPAEIDAAISAGGEVALGGAPARHRVLGETLAASPRAFFQGNELLLERLVGAVLGETRPAHAIDLYAGVGLFAVPLARRGASVVAVESDPEAVAWLRQNAAELTVEVREERVEAFVAAHAEGVEAGESRHPELIVLDPPRTGAARALAGIARLAPEQLAYVSCDPATLARDLGELVRLGFRVQSLRAFDLFPQTHHVEVVARLDRSG